MIPTHTKVKVTSNVTGRRVKPGISNDALPHLMDVLAGLYSDMTEATAREYITNAIDAHVAMGYDGPIKVTAPTIWEPRLIVQDFGIGMSAETLEDTYIMYGNSSKRESNDFNGTLGIGSKSAYAYSGTFVVQSVKDGLRNTLSLFKNDMGEPDGVLVEEDVPTDAPNGTSVTIPVTDVHAMNEAIKNVCKVMPEGLVLVDGKDLSERDQWTLVASNVEDDNGQVVLLNLWTLPSNYWSAQHEARVIMGNVAYRTISDITLNDFRDRTVYAEIPNGTVPFAPSREKLKESVATSRVESLIKKAYKDNLAKSLIKNIQDAETHFEALSVYSTCNRTLIALGHKTLPYKGKDLPDLHEHLVNLNTNPQGGKTIAMRTYRPNVSRNSVEWSPAFSYDAIVSGKDKAIIVNVPQTSISSTMKKKIKQYNEREGLVSKDYYAHFILITEGLWPSKNVWLKDAKVIDWSVIDAEVLPRAARTSTGGGGGVKTKGKHYHMLEDLALKEIEDDSNLWYMNARDYKYNSDLHRAFGHSTPYTPQMIAAFVSEMKDDLGPDAVVVDVYANRMEKFCRDYHDAKELTPEFILEKKVEKALNSLTPEDYEQWAAFKTVGRYGEADDRMNCIPDADPDKAWLLDMKGHAVGYSKVGKVERLLNSNDDYKKSREDALRAAKQRQEDVSARYPIFSLHSGYYLSNEDKATITRYCQQDWDNFNKEDN